MARNIRYGVAALAAVISLAPEGARAQSVLSTILGSPVDGSTALTSTLSIPCSAVTDSKGNVFVGLKGTHQVVRIDKFGGLWLVAGSGVLGSAGDGGPAKGASLMTPAGLALDSAGNLFIADSDANRIRRVGTDGVITTIAGNGKLGYTGDNGPAALATLKNASALTFDKNGNLLVADTGNNVIRKIATDGTISTIIGNGVRGSAGNGGPALSASLNSPAGVAVDGSGNIYVADTKNNWIRMVAPSGTISRFAGVDTAVANGADLTIPTNATITLPISLVIDPSGNMYFVQYGLSRILKISNGKISSYVGTGRAGTSGDGGWARFANINALGIAVDSPGNLILADGVTNRVRVVTAATGFIDTIAGSGLDSYSPRGLAVKGNDLYFSDGRRIAFAALTSLREN